MKPKAHGIISDRSQALIDYADSIAEEAHRGQNRKYTGEPYIIHPRAVARIVASVTDDVNMICAALLHDTIEDTTLTLQDLISKGFGYPIARLVDGLSDPVYPPSANRAHRITMNRMHTAGQSADVHTVKLADLIHNSEDISKYDPGFTKQFMMEKGLLVGYLIDGNPILLARAFHQLGEYY